MRKVSVMTARLAILFAGVTLLGLGIAFAIKADLGVNPWTVFHIGISNLTNLSVGRVTQVVGFLLVLMGGAVFRQVPGIGTIINMLGVGFAVDFFLARLPEPVSIGWQLLFLGFGILLIGVGTGTYISCRLGAGPRDGIMLGLAKLSGWSVGRVRSTMELAVLVVGFILGGPVGLGTLFGVGVGPIVQWSLGFLSRLWDSHLFAKAGQSA